MPLTSRKHYNDYPSETKIVKILCQLRNVNSLTKLYLIENYVSEDQRLHREAYKIYESFLNEEPYKFDIPISDVEVVCDVITSVYKDINSHMLSDYDTDLSELKECLKKY